MQGVDLGSDMLYCTLCGKPIERLAAAVVNIDRDEWKHVRCIVQRNIEMLDE